MDDPLCLRKLWAAEAIMIHYTPRGPNVPRQRQHFSLRTNAERISIKFVGSNHYHHQMNWLYFG